MKNKFSTFVFLALTILFSSCINYYKKGNVEFSNLQYHKAIENYNKAIAKNDNHEAKIKLAECYRLVNDYKNAEITYKEVVNYPEIEPLTYIHYAKILMNKKDYKSAKIWLNKYLEKVPKDTDAEMLLTSCSSINQFMKDTTLFTLNRIEFTGFDSEFAEVPYKNGIVFTANKAVKKKSLEDPWTGSSFYDLYFSEKGKNGKWSSPEALNGINGRFHEGPAIFNKAGDQVFFTRSNYFKNKPIENSNNENNLKIFSEKLVNGNWTKLEELPFDSDDYSVGHPCLSNDEKTLYFISDMKGGFGGTDIYKSVFNGVKWGSPENLGREINSYGDEMFPFMSLEGILYFSSDGHTNLGGLDIFFTSFDTKANKWLQAENLNYPINSSKDDFSFYYDNKKGTGYISSNRNDSDNIYEFKKNDPTFNLSGTVSLEGSQEALQGVAITLINENVGSKNEEFLMLTDINGKYHFKLKPDKNYVVYASKEEYFTKSTRVSTKGEKYSKDYVVDFVLSKIVIEKPIVIENIYYDFDKWNIRPDAAIELDKFYKLLIDNPSIYVEMGSHTDCRGKDKYNLNLSEKRAHSVVKYLVSKGIDENRLTHKGYGETVLVNHCKDGVECTEEEHQKNRRTEFKVTKIVK